MKERSLEVLGTGICKYCEHGDCFCIQGIYRNEDDLTLHSCDRRNSIVLYNVLLSLYESCGLNSKRNYKTSDYRGDKSRHSMEELKCLAENSDNLLGDNYYVYGPNGTQKTTICRAIGKGILQNHLEQISRDHFGTNYVRYTSMGELMNLLVAENELDTDKIDSEKMYQLDKIRNCQVLFLDESFDNRKSKFSKTNTYAVSLLDLFIRKRLESAKFITVFISNTPPNEIDTDIFGPSLVDLVDRECNHKLLFRDRYDEITRMRKTL